MGQPRRRQLIWRTLRCCTAALLYCCGSLEHGALAQQQLQQRQAGLEAVDQRQDCRRIVANNGCRSFEVLETCAATCLAWLRDTDGRVLNPAAEPHGPMVAPPGERCISIC